MITVKTSEGEFTYTVHAMKRMKQRGISEDEIIETIRSPKRVSRYFSRQDCLMIYGQNNVRIVIQPEDRVIITVMRKNTEIEKQKRIHSKRKNAKKYGYHDPRPKKGNRLKPWSKRERRHEF